MSSTRPIRTTTRIARLQASQTASSPKIPSVPAEEGELKDDHVEDKPCSSSQSEAKRSKEKQRKVATVWTFDESMVFYDALKEHGKNFELIAGYLEKKKVFRDKDQVRNFFFNTYKMSKDKPNIDETEWGKVPYAAREMLIVINSLEWKKRTQSAAMQPHRFTSLVISGSSNIKQQGKRGPVSIKTPNCFALRKFFPSMKQLAQLPSSFTVNLVPYSYSSKDYVNQICEQNPFLSVNIAPQNSLEQLFDLLEMKWTPVDLDDEVECIPKITLHFPEDFKPVKLHILNAGDLQPSLTTLRNDLDQKDTDQPSSVLNSDCLDFKEIFQTGLTRENSLHINFLQLFLFFNENQEIKMRYEIGSLQKLISPFVKLSELFLAGRGITPEVRVEKKNNNTAKEQENKPEKPEVPVIKKQKQPNKRMAEMISEGVDVVRNEREMFKQQIQSMREDTINNSKKRKIIRMQKGSATPSTSKEPPPTDFSPLAATIPSGDPQIYVPHHEQVYNPSNYIQVTIPPHEHSGHQDRMLTTLRPPQFPNHSHRSRTFDEILNEDNTLTLPSPSKSLIDDAGDFINNLYNINSNDALLSFDQLRQVGDSQHGFQSL